MVNFEKLLQDTPLPDRRLRDRASLLFQSLLRGQSANSLGLLSPADRTQESFTRGAYRFFGHEDVTLPVLHSPMQAALRQLVCPLSQTFVAHDVSVLNYSGHERKEDLIPVGNNHTWGYELFQSLVIQKGGNPLGAAFTELRNSQGLLSSQSAEILPFTDHLEQTERAIDAVEKLLPGCQLVHLCDREFDDLQLLRHLADRKYVIRCKHLSRLVKVHGEQQSLRKHLAKVELIEAGEVVRRMEKSLETYTLWVGETVVTMHGESLRGVASKKQRPQSGPALRVRVVVSELRQPGQKTLRWVLLTNLKDSVLDVVDAYLARWKIERLFIFQKSDSGWSVGIKRAPSGLRADFCWCSWRRRRCISWAKRQTRNQLSWCDGWPSLAAGLVARERRSDPRCSCAGRCCFWPPCSSSSSTPRRTC